MFALFLPAVGAPSSVRAGGATRDTVKCVNCTPVPAPRQAEVRAQSLSAGLRRRSTGILGQQQQPLRGLGVRAAAAAGSSPTAQELTLYKEMLKVAIQAAEAGASVVEAALDKPRNIEYKGATDLVTDTDKGSEAAVLGVLQSAYPDHALLGEEGGVFGNTASEYLWCVDPLDGTTNFAHRYPSFAVSVAVARRGAPVAACVVEFTGGPGAWGRRRFTAALGGGAFCNGAPIRASGATEIRRALLVTGFGYEHGADWRANMELFKHFTDVCQGVRRLGAAANDMCHVALGILDGYWEYQLKPWDMAAGALVLQEAGGVVTKGDGTPFSIFSRSVIATNAGLHSQVLAKVGPATVALRDGGFDLDDWFVPKGYEYDK